MSSAQNVQVAVRCRPLSEQERRDAAPVVLSCNGSRREVAVAQMIAGKQHAKTYTFDHVFGQGASQEDVFGAAVQPIVDEVLKGFNCTVFAYGQTGTGKTFTMEGDRARESLNAGVIPRAVHQVFDVLESSSNEYNVRVSYMELYNEELHDLLNDAPQQGQMRIYEDASGKRGVSVSNLEEVTVKSADDIFNILDKSFHKRITAETALNKQSSRSHSIFTMTLHIKETTPEGEELLKVGKLNMVDLAGSENIGRSKAVNQRAREAGMINQSLLTLGRVITALTEHRPHVPYRESKLTRLLQESLGGRAKTCIIATVSPASHCLEETMSTLDYAHRAKNIRNRPEVNQKMTKKALIREYASEIEKLKSELQCAREKNGVFLPLDKYQGLESQLKFQQEQIQEMEAALDGKLKSMDDLKALFEATKAELAEEEAGHAMTKEELQAVSNRLADTIATLTKTKSELDDKIVLLGAHQTTEKELTAEATTLLETVTACLADVDGLFAKVDRKAAVESANQALAGSFEAQISDELAAASTGLEAFRARQAAGMDALAGMATDLASRHYAMVADVRKQTDAVRDQVCTGGAAQLEALATHCGQANERMAALEKAAAQSGADVSTMTLAASTAVADGAAAVGRVLDGMDAATAAWAAEAQREAEAHLAAALDFAAAQEAAMGKVKALVAARSKEHAASLLTQQAELEAFKAERAGARERARAELMAQIAVMVDETMSAEEAAVGAFTDQAAARLETTAANIEATAPVVSDAVDVVGAACAEWATTERTHAGAVGRSIEAASTAASEGRESARATLGKMAEDAQLQLDAVAKHATAAAEDMMATHELVRQDLYAIESQQRKRVNDMLSQIETGDEKTSNQLDCLGETVHAGASQMEQAAADAADQLGDAVAQAGAKVAHLGEAVGGYMNNIQADEATGMTPVKKAYKYPTEFSQTGDYAAILGARAAPRESRIPAPKQFAPVEQVQAREPLGEVSNVV